MKYVDPKRVLFAAASFILVMTIFVGLAIWRLREDAIADALRETDNMATILAEEVGHSTRAIEIVLDELAVSVAPKPDETDAAYKQRLQSTALFDHLKSKLGQLPQADLISVIDRNGVLQNMTRMWPTTPVDLSDRGYFRQLARPGAARMVVSDPMIGRASGLWTIYFAKRIETRDGAFAGVVYVGVRPEYFIRAVEVIGTIPERTMLLVRSDGNVLLRFPDPVSRAGFVIPPGSQWYQLPREGGTYLSDGLFDGLRRWIAVRPVDDYPLVVDVGVSENQMLAAWRVRAFVIAGGSFVIEILFAILMRSLYLQLVRLRASEDELTAKSKHIELVNQRFEAALSNTTHGIAMFDAGGNLLIKNGKYERILGFHTIEFQFLASDDDERGSPDADRTYLGEGDLIIKAVARDGQRDVVNLQDGRSISVTTASMAEGGWVTTLEDITESQRISENIVRMAHFDGLTKIANRTKFMAELATVLSDDASGSYGVMLLDLDRFKEVNDTYGHGIGDELLQMVAQRLVSAIPTTDLVARLGGDEFAILCVLADRTASDLEQLCERLLATIGSPFVIQHNDIAVGLSIGIAIGNCGVNAVEEVMRHADLALYQAKSDGRNCYRFFELAMQERYHQRQVLTIELEQAIRRGELIVYYQPIVDARTHAIVSMEALVRWHHAKRGTISPADFVPLAEESGLIYALGEWVLRRACRDAATWPSGIRVAVNVSTLQLGKPAFAPLVAEVLRTSGLSAARLKLEMTESVLLSETGQGLANLRDLRALGVAIILDDFGTGYSSLSYLKRFHFDEIKIDKSFVDDLGNHRSSTAIIAATITLARELGIVTTAEGVETDDQRLLLQAAGVQQMQGYYFGKPAPASAWSFEAADAAMRALA